VTFRARIDRPYAGLIPSIHFARNGDAGVAGVGTPTQYATRVRRLTARSRCAVRTYVDTCSGSPPRGDRILRAATLFVCHGVEWTRARPGETTETYGRDRRRTPAGSLPRIGDDYVGERPRRDSWARRHSRWYLIANRDASGSV